MIRTERELHDWIEKFDKELLVDVLTAIGMILYFDDEENQLVNNLQWTQGTVEDVDRNLTAYLELNGEIP